MLVLRHVLEAEMLVLHHVFDAKISDLLKVFEADKSLKHISSALSV